MSCTNCIELKKVSICVNDLIIGTVGSNNTLYNIYFRSVANGMLIKYTATSSNAGLLTLSPTDGFIFPTNTFMELFVNKTTSSSTGESLTIGGSAATCYKVMFEQVYDMTDVYTYVNQTLERA